MCGVPFEKGAPAPRENFYGTADMQSGGYPHGRRKYLRRGKRDILVAAPRRDRTREFSRSIAADLMWG